MSQQRQTTSRQQRRIRRRGLLAAVGTLGGMLAASLTGGTAAAQSRITQENLLPASVSLQEAVQIATRRRPGRVVRAVTVDGGGGRRIHEVRILLEEGGRVVTVRVDAQNGAVR